MGLVIFVAIVTIVILIAATVSLSKVDKEWVWTMGFCIFFVIVFILGAILNRVELDKYTDPKNPPKFRMVITTDTTYEKI